MCGARRWSTTCSRYCTSACTRLGRWTSSKHAYGAHLGCVTPGRADRSASPPRSRRLRRAMVQRIDPSRSVLALEQFRLTTHRPRRSNSHCLPLITYPRWTRSIDVRFAPRRSTMPTLAWVVLGHTRNRIVRCCRDKQMFAAICSHIRERFDEPGLRKMSRTHSRYCLDASVGRISHAPVLMQGEPT